jgi:hypothetical protein
MSAVEKILDRLDGVRRSGAGRWRARCPSHGSRGGSLAIAEKDDRVLLHCFAGCETGDVLASLGLELADLFDRPLDHSRDRLRRAWSVSDVLATAMAEVAVVAIVAADLAERRPISPSDWYRLSQASSRLARLDQLVRQ